MSRAEVLDLRLEVSVISGEALESGASANVVNTLATMPAITGATIWAIDIRDCMMPMTMPCRCRAARDVINAVRLGRRIALPNVNSPIATSKYGMP